MNRTRMRILPFPSAPNRGQLAIANSGGHTTATGVRCPHSTRPGARIIRTPPVAAYLAWPTN